MHAWRSACARPRQCNPSSHAEVQMAGLARTLMLPIILRCTRRPRARSTPTTASRARPSTNGISISASRQRRCHRQQCRSPRARRPIHCRRGEPREPEHGQPRRLGAVLVVEREQVAPAEPRVDRLRSLAHHAVFARAHPQLIVNESTGHEHRVGLRRATARKDAIEPDARVATLASAVRMRREKIRRPLRSPSMKICERLEVVDRRDRRRSAPAAPPPTIVASTTTESDDSRRRTSSLVAGDRIRACGSPPAVADSTLPGK